MSDLKPSIAQMTLNLINLIIKSIYSLYFVLLYGKISEKVEDTIEAWGSPCVCEKSYWARGKCIGYWAYGHFEHCPESIYYGQDLMGWCYE